LGDSNLLALASHIATPYYIGYGTAAAHYGLTTQHRNVIILVTPEHVRERQVGESRVRIVNPAPKKFFGFESVDVLGHNVMIADREKTAIDCVDRPALAGGAGEAATVLATASRRFDWNKAADYLERIGSGALVRRFGWLADHVKAELPQEVRERLVPLPCGKCPVRSAMTRRGMCSLMSREKNCTAAPGSASAKQSGRKSKNAHAATGAALLQ
jgi:predicted transcriptional regulator of viral defense system